MWVARICGRLVVDLSGRDGSQLPNYMYAFQAHGSFEVGANELETLRASFVAGRTDNDASKAVMRAYQKKTGYIADPHTAIGLAVADRLLPTSDIPTVALSTAHPVKFGAAVEEACGITPTLPAHMADLYEREERFEVMANDKDALQRRVLSGIVS